MEDCIFCKIANGEISSQKVYEDEHTFAFFDINPKNDYHTLVIPKKHYADIFDVPEDEALAIMKTVKRITSLFREKLGLTDVQIMNNSGKNAQQIVFHLHFHILPRFPDDGRDSVWPPTKEELCGRFDELMQKLK